MSGQSPSVIAGALLVLVACLSSAHAQTATTDAYFDWSSSEAEQVGRRMRQNGRVGGWFDGRIVHTEHSINYKLRATWLTPEVIRAAARLAQLRDRLSRAETEALVTEAEAAGDTVVLVEIDPREGSGVIPNDWRALLQPKGLIPDQPGAVRGRSEPKLRRVTALNGVFKRDYNYDLFWVTFPLLDDNGEVLFNDSVSDVELLVLIRGKEGRVSFRIPESIRHRAERLKMERRAVLGGTSDDR